MSRVLATEDTFLDAYSRRRANRRHYGRAVITFDVGGELYGLPILDLVEIIKLRDITEVPRVPRFVVGVLTLRGRVIPILDLRVRLGLPEIPRTRASRILVATRDDEHFGLVCDAVRGVVRLTDDEVESQLAMGGAESEFIAGVARTDGHMIILLDVRAVTTFAIEPVGAR